MTARRGINVRIVEKYSLSNIEKGKWYESSGKERDNVEPAYDISEGYCIRIKFKESPTNPKDAALWCFEKDDLRNAWLKSFKAALALDLDDYYDLNSNGES